MWKGQTQVVHCVFSARTLTAYMLGLVAYWFPYTFCVVCLGPFDMPTCGWRSLPWENVFIVHETTAWIDNHKGCLYDYSYTSQESLWMKAAAQNASALPITLCTRHPFCFTERPEFKSNGFVYSYYFGASVHHNRSNGMWVLHMDNTFFSHQEPSLLTHLAW